MAPPPGAGSARVRSDSTLSDDADAFEDDRRQRSPPKKSSEAAPVIVPAPPPKTNVWEKRKSETKVVQQSSSEQREERKSDDSSGGGGGKVSEKEPERQKEEKEQENRETKEVQSLVYLIRPVLALRCVALCLRVNAVSVVCLERLSVATCRMVRYWQFSSTVCSICCRVSQTKVDLANVSNSNWYCFT